MNQPRLSICMPVYNGQRFLRGAVESVLGQTFADFELVIADNASTDETEAICREYAKSDARVRYFRNDKNLGAAPNFNRAFELSRGELVRWASHDDLWAPDAMRACVEVLDSDPAVVCCHGRTIIVDEAGEPIPSYDRATGLRPSPRHVLADRIYDPPNRRLDDPRARTRLADLLLRTHWCFEIFGVIRRSALARSSLHGSYYGSDKVLLAELAMAGRIASVGQTVFYRRDHGGNSTSLRTHTERADWMDTSLHGHIRRPYLKLLSGYLGAIRRSNQSMAEKLACMKVVASWMFQVRKLKTVMYESDSQTAEPEPVSAHS